MKFINFMKKKEDGCCSNVDEKSMTGAVESVNSGPTIKILGSGCAKCNQLEAATKEALKILGSNEEIGHVRDFAEIASYGVMTTPALVVDGKVISYGKVLKAEEVVNLIRQTRG